MGKTDRFIQFYPILPNWFYPLGKTAMPTLNLLLLLNIAIFSILSAAATSIKLLSCVNLAISRIRLLTEA